MKDLLVMKFGGTSMGSAERIRSVSQICVNERRHRPILVVVSAMSKVTDQLLETLRLAETGHSMEVEANLKKLEARHVETCRELLPEPSCSAAICEVGIIVGEFS